MTRPLRKASIRTLVATGLLWGVPALATAQAPDGRSRSLRLGAPTGRVTAEFTRIASIRALSDGRIVILDTGDHRIVVVDFSRNSATQIGRQGQGPGEYQRLLAMIAVGGDSTVITDPGNGRWLVLDADRIVNTLPSDHPAIRAARGTIRTADRAGRLLVFGPPPIGPETHRLGRGDSVFATLVQLTSGRVDTVASLETAPLIIWKTLDATGSVTRSGITRPPWAVGEEPLLFPDGWMAVARLGPYRLDWRAPSGAWVRGSPLEAAEVQADAREREAFLARIAASTGKPAPMPAADTWPATIPPFQPAPLVGLPDGTVLVLRTPTADRPGQLYDRIDRRGRLMSRLELPTSDRLMAVSGSHAYVVATDDDGVQRIVRYPWR